MIPATRQPFRNRHRPTTMVAVGLAALLLTALLPTAGMPAPAEIAAGGPHPSLAAVSSPSAEALAAPVRAVAQSIAERTLPELLPPIAACRLGPLGIAPAEAIYHGPRDAKVVALTFDDGWGGRNLEKIVRLLREKRVNATFFPVGQAIRHEPDAWRAVAASGFPIADHTFDHGTLEGLCYVEQLDELRRARATIVNALGVTPLPVLRPPGGLFDDATRAAATAAGEPAIVLWDVDTRDWTGIGPAQIRATALAGREGSIVVLHTSSPSTLRALPGIIRGYRKRGFEFVTIGQLLGIDGPVPYPAAAGA